MTIHSFFFFFFFVVKDNDKSWVITRLTDFTNTKMIVAIHRCLTYLAGGRRCGIGTIYGDNLPPRANTHARGLRSPREARARKSRPRPSRRRLSRPPRYRLCASLREHERVLTEARSLAATYSARPSAGYPPRWSLGEARARWPRAFSSLRM